MERGGLATITEVSNEVSNQVSNEVSDRVRIVDVSPRDGLQNESKLLSTGTKVEMIARILGAGVTQIEATSFVDPRRVPAMADAEELMRSVPRRDGITYVGLALNRKGAERAAEASCDVISYALPVTDGFAQANQGTTVRRAIEVWGEISEVAHSRDIATTLILSVAFGCPYEGEVSAGLVFDVADRALGLATPDTISLADTIGVGTPRDVGVLFDGLAEARPNATELGCHFHNTRNTGYANAYTAFESGVRSFDASLGGIGGCPFAPNATGNIATEDLVYMFDREGIDTGIDLEGLGEAAVWLRSQLGESVVGLYSRAGPFPTR